MYFSVSFYVCSPSIWPAEPAAFARTLPDRQGVVQANRLWNLAGAASGVAGLATDSSSSDPDLMTRTVTSQAKITAPEQSLLDCHGELRFCS